MARSFAGMGPCLGVPPVDCLYYNNDDGRGKASVTTTAAPLTTTTTATTSSRRRHFSLEDCYHDDTLDCSSSSSNESSNASVFMRGGNARGLLHHKEGRMQEQEDLNHFKSFINDFSFGCDDAALHACLDLDTAAFVSSSLRLEFEARLRRCIEESNPDLVVAFPQGLLGVVAGHVLQEAAEEPYGMKGCLLHIYFEGEAGLHHLGSLDCDPETQAKTFELTLTLRQGQTTWGQRMARRLSFTSSSTLTVSTSYKLVKKRKYRNEAEAPTDFDFMAV